MYLLSLPGTALKENTWIPSPTCPLRGLSTAAQDFSPVESRWNYPQVVFLLFFQTGLACCWRSERESVRVEHRAVLAVTQSVDKGRKPSQAENQIDSRLSTNQTLKKQRINLCIFYKCVFESIKISEFFKKIFSEIIFSQTNFRLGRSW